MTFLKLICLIVAIAYGFTCFGRLYRNQSVSELQIIFMDIGIAGFIIL